MNRQTIERMAALDDDFAATWSELLANHRREVERQQARQNRRRIRFEIAEALPAAVAITGGVFAVLILGWFL